MPRRYKDYADSYWFWNYFSSLGSIISIVGLLFFFFIIWERLYAMRKVIFINSPCSQVEWCQNTPPRFHEKEDSTIYKF